MNITTIACLAIVAAFLAVLLRPYRPEIAMAIGVALGLVVLAFSIKELEAILASVRNLLTAASLSWEYGRIVFQAMGICLLTQLSADACRDAGETAMASKVELAAKLLLVGLSLPLLEKIAEMAAALISGEAVTG